MLTITQQNRKLISETQETANARFLSSIRIFSLKKDPTRNIVCPFPSSDAAWSEFLQQFTFLQKITKVYFVRKEQDKS